LKLVSDLGMPRKVSSVFRSASLLCS
jgi:hypothetical protein